MKTSLAARLDQANRNLMFTGLLLLGTATALLWWGPRDLKRIYVEPERITVQGVSDALDNKTLTRTYLSVFGDRAIDTNYVKMEKGVVTGRERRAASFVALALGNRLLLVKARPGGGTTPHFKGVLVPLSDDVKEEVLRPLEAQYPSVKGRFITVMLDATGVPLASISLFAAALATILIGCFFLHRGARGLEDPTQYAPLKDIARRNELGSALEQIEFETRTDPKRIQVGKTILTSGWIVASSSFRVDIMRMGELAWVYKIARKPWALTSRQTVGVRDMAGNMMEIRDREADAAKLHDELVLRAPWVVTGHNRSLEVLWTVDRNAFLSEVKERREDAAKAG